MIALAAHELAYIPLVVERGLEPDHEGCAATADLFTVFFGLGVLTANSCIREEYFPSTRIPRWSMTRRGAMGMREFGYALARFARARGETAPTWAKSLRPDVRDAFRKSMRYLSQ